MNPQTITAHPAKRRKRRPQGLHAKLSPEQMAALSLWLGVENISYAQAKDRLKSQFGIETNISTLSQMFSKTLLFNPTAFEFKVVITTPTGGVQEFVLPVK